jgi:hypothetical protein
MFALGLSIVVVAAALALTDAFGRTGPLARWLGWNAMRGLGARALDTLTATPLLIALLAAGGTLIAAAVFSRK